jgi:hypothetical protein
MMTEMPMTPFLSAKLSGSKKGFDSDRRVIPVREDSPDNAVPADSPAPARRPVGWIRLRGEPLLIALATRIVRACARQLPLVSRVEVKHPRQESEAEVVRCRPRPKIAITRDRQLVIESAKRFGQLAPPGGERPGPRAQRQPAQSRG